MCQANSGIGETNIQTKFLAFMNLHQRVRMCIGWGEQRLEAVCQTVVNATGKYKAGRKGTEKGWYDFKQAGGGRHCHNDDTDPVTWK